MKKLWLPATAVVLTIIAVGVGVFLARPSSSPESVLPGELAPGSALPSDAQCTARVQRNPWEPRPENTQANHTVPPTPYPNPTRSWSSNRANQLKTRVDGQFTGTTDEIIQWSACKWGYPVEVARAQAVDESHWYQSHRSDGGVSYGLFQLKSTVWTGTLPWSQNSTAYNADWAMGVWRACYEGLMYYGPQSRGNTWGCVGAWWSGRWLDDGGKAYVGRVQSYMAKKPYREWPSSAGGVPPN